MITFEYSEASYEDHCLKFAEAMLNMFFQGYKQYKVSNYNIMPMDCVMFEAEAKDKKRVLVLNWHNGLLALGYAEPGNFVNN